MKAESPFSMETVFSEQKNRSESPTPRANTARRE
jgi:hypothetical protein